MTNTNSGIHGQWSTRWVFILAATGAAVGLGNIWRFPYMTGENGGGAFLLLYLVCVLLLGLPVLICEVMIGRRGQHSPVRSILITARETNSSHRWSLVGWMGVLTGLVILSYYSVIAGWVMHYVWQSAVSGWNGADAASVGDHFNALVSNRPLVFTMHSLFMLMTAGVVVLGVQKGLERCTRYLMPLLFWMLILMILYSTRLPGFEEGVRYLFQPDFSIWTQPKVFLMALGQAFFSLSIGMGALMAYGAYLPRHMSVPSSCLWVVLMDSLVAILAGLMVFPLIFSYGLDPAGGPGLIFKILPVAFGQMPGGVVFGAVFFLLLTFAAWTSSISLIEPAVAWLTECPGWNRRVATGLVGFLVWVVGIFSVWSSDILGQLDTFASNFMLPAGALMLVLFVGWRLPRSFSQGELGLSPLWYTLWLWAVRVIAPLAIAIILLSSFIE